MPGPPHATLTFDDLPATGLPVESATDAIRRAVAAGTLVLRAEPGAGKSSLVPLIVAASMADSPARRVVVTEPRRLAARATAERLASLLGESVGSRVGLTVRGEQRRSADTVIEVVTEAVLTNRLQSDPELEGVGAVVFDEFHERNLASDLGLAMALEVRQVLRPDLVVVVMSATLDVERLLPLLGDPTVVDVPGRTFPVSTEYLRRPAASGWTAAVCDATLRALELVEGDVLVFVPGRREIDAVLGALRPRLDGRRVDCLGLHGSTPIAEQRSILRGGPGRRVIVATSVAETSITVPGVAAVVDGGLLRRARFDPLSGLGRLETGSVTTFAADQRRGRAGRLGPGVALRLWSVDDERHLDRTVPPAIVDGDPLPVAFDLARWGDPWAERLPLLDHPTTPRLEAAQRSLRLLGLTVDGGALSARGRQAARLGLHPRLAALAITADEAGLGTLGVRAAALLDDDRWPTRADFDAELERRWREVDTAADRLARRLGVTGRATPFVPGELGPLLARAWPDRIAMARPGRPGRFLLAIGREVDLDLSDPLAAAAFIVVVEADGAARSARVRRAVALTRTEVLEVVGDRVEQIEHVEWDDRDDTLRAERRRQLGSIVLHREPLTDPRPDAVEAALRTGLRRRGLGLLTWNERSTELRARLAWLHGQDPTSWPDVTDAVLLDRIDDWLDLRRCRSVADLRRIVVADALLSLVGWEQRRDLDRLAPTALATPSAPARPIRYDSGRPVWSVRIQHLFGVDVHPTIGPNRTPLVIELLSPAGRPAQVTTDLPGFWRGSYSQVRAELRGRYPKHRWPDDPTV